MDNYVLLALIAMKGICLFLCWKGVKMSGKHPRQPNGVKNLTERETKKLEAEMTHMMKRNEQLKKELENLK